MTMPVELQWRRVLLHEAPNFFSCDEARLDAQSVATETRRPAGKNRGAIQSFAARATSSIAEV
jgi:hypothetical protein